MNILVRDIVPVLFAQWTKANAEFKFPVTIHNEALCGRVKRLWEEGVKFSQGKGKLVDKQNFRNKLDKFMDSIKCQCPIQLCSVRLCECWWEKMQEYWTP